MDVGEGKRESSHHEECLRIVELIGSELDPATILTEILASACRALDAESGEITTVDADGHITDRVSFPADPGVGGRANATGEKVLWKGNLMGYITLWGATPSEKDLKPFAQYAAIVLENQRLLEENKRGITRTSLLLHTTERIGNAMSVDDVVRAYLDQVASNGRYTCTVVLYEFDEEGRKIGNLVRGQWGPGGAVDLTQHRIPATQKDTLDPILAAGQTVRIANALTDPEIPETLREEQRRDGRPAVALVPLVAEGRRIGLVILSEEKVHNWTDEELVPFQTTAVQLAAALQSRTDHDKLIDTDRRLAVSEERRRLARELHDSVTQILFSLNLLAQSLEPEVPSPREIVDRIVELSRRGLGEMRSLLEELRPVNQPQRPTLRQQIASHASALVGLPECTIDDSGYTPVPPTVEQQLFRVAQEALNNVAKHAKARQARVTLQASDSVIRLMIEDDGIGIDRESEKPRVGFGMAGMQERAEEIGATVRVTSQPGMGTAVELTLPREEK